LSQADLFSKFWHEIVFSVQVFQGGLSLELSFSVNRCRVQQKLSFFFLVEQESDFIARIEELIGEEGIRIVVILTLSDHIAPPEFSVCIEKEYHNIFRNMANHIVLRTKTVERIIKSVGIETIHRGKIHHVKWRQKGIPPAIEVIKTIPGIVSGTGIIMFRDHCKSSILHREHMPDELVIEG